MIAATHFNTTINENKIHVVSFHHLKWQGAVIACSTLCSNWLTIQQLTALAAIFYSSPDWSSVRFFEYN